MIGTIEGKLNGGKLTLEIGLDKLGQVSRTGKSKIHASTGGFLDVEGYSVNMNIIKKI